MWKALVSILVAMTFAAAATAQTAHRVAGADWTIQIPKDWKVAPDKRLRDINAQAKSAVQSSNIPSFDYVLMLIPKSDDGRYVLVQHTQALPPGVSFQEVIETAEKSMRQGLEVVRDAIPGGQFELSPGGVNVDRARQRLLTSMEISVANGQPLRCLSTQQFGVRHSVVVHGYVPEKSFSMAGPGLQAIADSFAFDPGASYTFAAKPRKRGYDLNQTVVAALIGGAVAGTFALIRKVTSPS